MALTSADSPKRLLILVDPHHQIDVAHLSRITQAIPEADIVPLPSVNHDTIAVLAGSVPFSNMLEAVRNGGSLAAALSPYRRSYAHRREVMIGRLLARGQGERAVRVLDGWPLDDRERTKQLIRFLRHGAAQHVVRAAQRNARMQAGDPLALAAFAAILGRAGKSRRANAVAARVDAAGVGKTARELIRIARGETPAIAGEL